jgi:O-methyltransferase
MRGLSTTSKRLLQGLFNRGGYHLIRLPSGRLYESIPLTTYAPWNASAEFRAVWTAIQKNTLVDIFRCWELWQLVGQAKKLSGSFIEVGVWRGGTGALIASAAKQRGIAAPIYLCDTFRGVVKAGIHDSAYKGGEHADTSIPTVEALMKSLGLTNYRIVEGIFPDATSHLIPENEGFRLCHIDVDVYDSARDIVDWVWSRLVPGGLIVYDDYGFEMCPGITRLVDEQMGLSDRMIFHNLNGHAVVIKLPDDGRRHFAKEPFSVTRRGLLM